MEFRFLVVIRPRSNRQCAQFGASLRRPSLPPTKQIGPEQSVAIASPWHGRLPRTRNHHSFSFARPRWHSRADSGKRLITD